MTCRCCIAVFFYFAAIAATSASAQPSRGAQSNTNEHSEIQQTNITDSEMVNRIWNEYWSDWINIGVAHENDSYVDYEHNNTEVEAQFLSVLHRVFKKSRPTCVDKQNDCRIWAERGFCTHVKSRYRSWMQDNCPQSCNLCEENLRPTSCKNRRPSCDILFRFCTGPFSEHMTNWCPQTCNLCSDPDGNHQEYERVPATNQSLPSSGNNISPLNNCFPTNCGVAPVLARRSGRRRKRFIRYGYSRPSPISLRIVGGARALRGEWPWHGLLVQQINEHARYCGITIICRHWVVTAAHCVVSPEQGFAMTRQIMKTFTIYVGRHQGLFGFSEQSTQSFTEENFDRFVIHPSFRLSPSFSHDIALIKLKWNSPIQFNRVIQPICLPTVQDLSHGDILTTYGWGSTLGHGPSSQYLKKIQVPFVNHEMCRRKVWGLEAAGILCAGGTKNTDTCSGDSGGSLVMKMPTNDSFTGRYFFYGVTSYGTHYCNTRSPYKPGIYTDVAYYSAWIRKQTNGCCEEPPSPTQTGSFESRLAENLRPNFNTRPSNSTTESHRESNASAA